MQSNISLGAQLPNITGKLTNISTQYGYTPSGSTVFKKDSSSTGGWGTGGYSFTCSVFSFDASRASTIYVSKGTVRPVSYQVLWIIKH